MSRADSGRLLLRILGWLLTPFVAWAAAFFGGWLAALLASAAAPGRWSVGFVVAGAALGGAGGLAGWIWLLRRDRAVRPPGPSEEG